MHAKIDHAIRSTKVEGDLAVLILRNRCFIGEDCSYQFVVSIKAVRIDLTDRLCRFVICHSGLNFAKLVDAIVVCLSMLYEMSANNVSIIL